LLILLNFLAFFAAFAAFLAAFFAYLFTNLFFEALINLFLEANFFPFLLPLLFDNFLPFLTPLLFNDLFFYNLLNFNTLSLLTANLEAFGNNLIDVAFELLVT